MKLNDCRWFTQIKDRFIMQQLREKGFFLFLMLFPLFVKAQFNQVFNFEIENNKYTKDKYLISLTKFDSTFFSKTISKNVYIISDTSFNHLTYVMGIKSIQGLKGKKNDFNKFSNEIFIEKDTNYKCKIYYNSEEKTIFLQYQINDSTYLKPEAYKFFEEYGFYIALTIYRNTDIILDYNTENLKYYLGSKNVFSEISVFFENLKVIKIE